MLLTTTASDQHLRNCVDLPPAGHVLLAQLLGRLVHLVSDGLFLVPADCFQSFQLRTHSVISHCMPSSCVFSTCSHLVSKSSTFLRVLPMSPSNLFWSEGKSLSAARNGCTRVELNQNSTNCISTPHKKMRRRCNHSKNVASEASESNVCCITVSMSSKVIHPKYPSCV